MNSNSTMNSNKFYKGMESEIINDYPFIIGSEIAEQKDKWFIDIINNKLIRPISGGITKEKLDAVNVILNFQVYPNTDDEKIWIEQDGIQVGSTLIVKKDTDLDKGSYGFTITFE